jgi:hypothetical protein
MSNLRINLSQAVQNEDFADTINYLENDSYENSFKSLYAGKSYKEIKTIGGFIPQNSHVNPNYSDERSTPAKPVLRK